MNIFKMCSEKGRNVVINEINYNLLESEFKIQSLYYVHHLYNIPMIRKCEIDIGVKSLYLR